MIEKDDSLDVNFLLGFNFNPDWTLDEAMLAGGTEPTSPFMRWARWQALKEQRKEYEAGKKDALITSLFICAASTLPMPEWLCQEFANGFHKWVNYRVSSLDEAFDVQLPKGTHLNKLYKERRLVHTVFHKVKERKLKGQPTDQNLFDEVGKEVGAGGETVKKLYYKYKNSKE